MLAWKAMVRLLTLSGLILLLAAPTASAGVREKILRECQNGRITGNYTPGQLRDARRHIPTDLDEYSDCRDVLARAGLSSGGASGGGGGGGGSAAPGGVQGSGSDDLSYAANQQEQDELTKALSDAPQGADVAGEKIVPGASGPRGRRRPPRAADHPHHRADPARPVPRSRHGPDGASPCPRSPEALAPAPARRRARSRCPGSARHAATVIAVAVVLSAAAFGADGGLRLERLTWTEIGLVLVGAALVIAALLTTQRAGRVYGALTLAALAALTVFTAISINWSMAPSSSWQEANRTLAYLATLAGALALVRLIPGRWAAVLEGVAVASLIVCGWALATKVFPNLLAPDETFARLREPFGYWNAVGLMAALGVPPLLWLAARRSGHAAVNALAWPALGLLIVAMMLSYSRGALLALLVGLAFWFAVVPLRLRGVLPLIVASFASVPVVAWAFARDALSTDDVPLSARTDAGHDFGALLLLLCVVLLGLGLAANFIASERSLHPRTRVLAGRGVLAALALGLIAIVIGIAAAPGGINGQASKAWKQLTDPNVDAPTNTPDRLTATSSVRARYWQEALRIYRDSKLVGAGAGAYEVARTRYRRGTQSIRHAHGYGVQTLADLGLVGLGLSLLAAAAWLVAAMRATGLRRRDRGLPYDPERIGALTMFSVVVVFGFHSLVDWTWFVPGTVAVALLCAGWVAGRGPLRARLEAPAAGAGPAAALVAPGAGQRDRRRGRARPRADDLLDGAAARPRRQRRGALRRPRGARASSRRPWPPRTTPSSATRCRSTRSSSSRSSRTRAATARRRWRRSRTRSTCSPTTRRRGGASGATGCRSSTTPRARCARSRSPTSSTRSRRAGRRTTSRRRAPRKAKQP